MIDIIEVDKYLDKVLFGDSETGQEIWATGDFLDSILSSPSVGDIGFPFTGQNKETAMVIDTAIMFRAYKCLRQ